MSAAELRAALERLCKERPDLRFLSDSEEMTPYLREWRDAYRGEAAAVALPSSVEDVVALVKLARECDGVHLVPQGGNTGLVGGQIAFDSEHAITVSMARMNRILEIDPANNTLTCEAGALLADVQAAADDANKLFPLSLASQGSCRIGGVLSTNAGGCEVLRYGCAGDLLLGIEVVLSDGSVWDGMRPLRKDNTGYDLKRLFIGAEGTLGIITRAVLRLFPKPRSLMCAFVGIDSPSAGLSLLREAEEMSGGEVTAFELMPRIAIEMVERHTPSIRIPLESDAPWYVLLEISSSREEKDATDRTEKILANAFDKNLILDGTIANSKAQEENFWSIRESISESQKREGGSIKHDVSVSVSRMPEFLERATRAVEEALAGIRVVAFGHMGDGNIHFNLSQPTDMERDAFMLESERFHRIVYDIIADMGGSISAEHGIGIAKLEENARHKSGVEQNLMRALKRALDPGGIFNPGKLID